MAGRGHDRQPRVERPSVPDPGRGSRVLGLGGRLGSAMVGWTAPQEGWGALQLAKALATGGGNVRLGDRGEVMYDDPNLDTPAAAIGSFVATQPGSSNDPDVLKHELRHVDQSDKLGPAYIPAALGEAMFTDYGSGALERDAMKHTTPNAEMLRPGASMNKGEQNPLLQRLLEMLIPKKTGKVE